MSNWPRCVGSSSVEASQFIQGLPGLKAQISTDEQPEGPFLLSFPKLMNRRCWVARSAGVLSGAAFALRPSQAATTDSNPLTDLVISQQQAKSLELDSGLLESRVVEDVMSPPPYGMEGADILYPTWMAGTWEVTSTTTEVEAPCGVVLFGGNRTFASAQKEIGRKQALHYQSRFVPDGSNSRVIADREFNVKSIAKVAMGANSVVDVSVATPNKFSALLSPMGSPSMVTVDLITNNRRQEIIDDSNFHCSEVVRQIVSPVGDSAATQVERRSALLKEIETTSLYTLVSPTEVCCRQRSATFLLPSQEDPLQFQMWQATRGRPIDVRFYDVVYSRK